jgi:hypothetical protein
LGIEKIAGFVREDYDIATVEVGPAAGEGLA